MGIPTMIDLSVVARPRARVTPRVKSERFSPGIREKKFGPSCVTDDVDWTATDLFQGGGGREDNYEM